MARPTAQLFQGLQERQVRFAPAVVLDALPVCCPEVRLPLNLGHKGLHQGGLATTWRAPARACSSKWWRRVSSSARPTKRAAPGKCFRGLA